MLEGSEPAPNGGCTRHELERLAALETVADPVGLRATFQVSAKNRGPTHR